MRTVKEQQLQERIDELVAENALWRDEAKRWRDMYIEYDEMLESDIGKAKKRISNMIEDIEKMKKQINKGF